MMLRWGVVLQMKMSLFFFVAKANMLKSLEIELSEARMFEEE
jgi:hypothetical protein